MKMKRLALLLLAVLMVATMFSCTSGSSDLADVLGKNQMVIGITYYAPMDFKGEDGALTGFDYDVAVAVCSKLGVSPVFAEIEWAQKEIELNGRVIDCIWNGLTVDPERAENMSLSVNYMKNKQVVVVKAENAASITSVSDLEGKTGSAESGSAGEDAIKANAALAANLVGQESQAKALLEVKSGTADYCVIDAVMAKYLIGEGTDYADLTILETVLNADDEYYAVAFRKGSDLTERVNEILAELYADGTIDAIAAKYGLTDVLVPIQAAS